MAQPLALPLPRRLPLPLALQDLRLAHKELELAAKDRLAALQRDALELELEAMRSSPPGTYPKH